MQRQCQGETFIARTNRTVSYNFIPPADPNAGCAAVAQPARRLAHIGGAVYLLPGLVAGVAARSGGSELGAKASTCREIRLNIGTPKFTVPLERSTMVATPA